jgi:hypothetical protein
MKRSTDYADYAEGPNHEMVPENSPGLQPWEGVPKVSPCKGDRCVSCMIPGKRLSRWALGHLLSILRFLGDKNSLLRHTKLSAALTGRGSAWHIPRAKALGYSIKPFHGLELIALLALFLFAKSVSADPGQDSNKISPAPSSSPYAIVNHIGEADQQVTLREDKLLAHRRTIDPFGLAIRGKFKGLPPVEQHPAATNLPVQAVKAVTNELTLEKAIQQLPVGAVNITDREALIGFQSIREGDLLVLELSGHRFVVWVESIDRRGVQFCDINLQHHALKPFRFGPTQLPQASATGRSDIRDFLKEDAN